MNMVLNYLQYLGYILIFPGFLFCFVAGLLLCGIDRKLVARMQKRVGPPVLQPFYDFFKLCGKETIIPTAASKTTFLAAPIVGFAALVVIQLFIPIRGFTPFAVLGDIADVIVILYLLLIPAIATIMGGAASGSPYAGVGLSREMVTVISCELPLVLVLLAVGKVAGGDSVTFSFTRIAEYQLENGSLITHASLIPAALAFLLIIPGETGSHPFDTAEAETEICEGLLAEYSGAPLAVYKLCHSIKLLTMTSLFTALFLGGMGGGAAALSSLLGLSGGAAGGLGILFAALVMFLVCLAVTAVTVSLVHAVTARLKIEQVFKYYWTVVTGLAVISLVLAWYGL